jgi:outer membrane protein assembly factor BamB
MFTRRTLPSRLLFATPLIAINLLAPAAAQPRAPDWPQWRLTRKWKIEVGSGYATPLLVGNRLYVFTRQNTDEVMQALDAATGRQIWESRYAAPFKMSPAANRHGDGPKSTPTYDSGRLYSLGMGGAVTAFDAASGKRLWQTEPSSPGPLYGTAMSPLVDRGLVIVHVGGHDKGALTAFEAATGAVKWRWDGDGPAYNSPIAIDAAGMRQVVTFTQDNLIAVSAETGELLWQRPYKTRATQNTITPILYRDLVIVSGLDMPVTALRIRKGASGWEAATIWENPDVPLYMANGVIAGDTLVGMTHRNSGQFFALDANTGKLLWTSEPRQATNAAIVRAGDEIFALKDDAELLVLKLNRTRFDPAHRYTVADAATWAQPTISGNRIYVKDVSSLALLTLE